MKAPRIAIVVAQWNADITHALLQGALDHFNQNDISIPSSHIFTVPGSVELPIAAQRCALTLQFDMVIVYGAVIQGETDHYHYVSQMVTSGCQQVSLQHNIPIIFGVLTTQTHQLAQERVGGNKGHFGQETAASACMLWQSLEAIRTI